MAFKEEIMGYLKKLGLTTAACIALIAIAGASSAGATTLEVGGIAKNSSVAMTTTLKSGTSLIIKDESGFVVDTCTGSTIKGSSEGTFTGATVGGKISQLTFTGCTDVTVTLSLGSWKHSWVFGSTDGEVSLSGVEVTLQYTPFGISVTCKAGLGTIFGILKGVKSGKAILKALSKINCGIAGTLTWSGEYEVISPEGLGVVS
jgi:hypothetical protein